MGCLDGMFNLDVICHISNIYTTYICILFFFFFFLIYQLLTCAGGLLHPVNMRFSWCKIGRVPRHGHKAQELVTLVKNSSLTFSRTILPKWYGQEWGKQIFPSTTPSTWRRCWINGVTWGIR
jgi:hypothetical protein